MIGLKAMGFWIPDNFSMVKELAEVKKLTSQEADIYSHLRLETVVVADDSDSIDLAVRASEKALEKIDLLARELDLIIYLQSRVPAYLMSSEATRVQKRLGAQNAFAFTVTDTGCANINTALEIATNYLRANQELQNILICTGSKPCGKERYRPANTVIGDAGMGVIVGRTDSLQIVEQKIMTDGQFWDLYKLDYQQMLGVEYRELVSTSPRYKFQLSIASRNNFSQLNREILEKQQIKQIDAYIMQNLSIPAFEFNEDAFQVKFIPSCFANCQRYGHLGSIDILLNLQTGIEKGEISKDDYVLIMNNSPVACWSSLLVKI